MHQRLIGLVSLSLAGCASTGSGVGSDSSSTSDEPSSEASSGDGTSGETSSSSGSGTGSSSSSTGSSSDAGETTGSTTSASGDTALMPDDCITDVSPGHHVFTCDGYDFDVEIPAQCIAGSCGLIVDVHGLTMDADMQDANTTMRALGAERGYVVVQPNAINSSWVPGVDDGPVHAFALRAASVLQLDTNRLHFTGFSQGGAMSWRMLCDHADVYASIAPAAMCTPTYSLAGCAEGTPSILYIHGRLDALVGYAGCAEPQRDAVLDAYGLEGEGDLLEESDGHRHRRWGGGDLPSVEMIDHDYAAAAAVLAGHCYPGSADLEGGLPGQVFPFACVEANTFVYGETIIDFFDAHPKR